MSYWKNFDFILPWKYRGKIGLFWVELAFDWYEGAMVFRVFIFIFLSRTTGKKEHSNENLRHSYCNFFESAVLKVTWSQLRSSFISQQLRGTLARAFARHFTIEDFTKMDQRINMCANSFLVKHCETQIDERSRKIFSCTKKQACTLKNIAPKYKMTFHLT